MELEGLSVVCAGLGCASEDANGRRNGYIKSENCLENLKDLQRFLHRDHPQTRDVFKQLGKWNTMSQDLIPIIENYRDEQALIINIVKVIVFLTMPIDPSSDDIALQMEYLWSFKASLSRNDAIAVIVSLLEEPLEHLECGAFVEDDWKIIQLVLTLFRNLLAIQDPSPQHMMGRSTSQFAFLRDTFLEHLFHENVMDLILALTQHVAGLHGFLKEDNLLVLEIYHYIFWGQRPELVASAQQMNLKTENISHHSSVLKSMMEDEEEQRRLLHLRDLPRHSLFCGTFVRVAPDGSKRIVKRNPFVTPAESLLKSQQINRGPLKRIACNTTIPVSSKESVLGLLKNFADQFLDAAYNILMQSVREDIRREHPSIQSSDIIVFFEVANFFTAYQRCHAANCKRKNVNPGSNTFDEKGYDTLFRGLICGPIASTMNEAMFNMVISKWHYSFEALKETKDLKLLTTTGALIKEMIHMLDLVLKLSRDGLNGTEQEARTARILLYKVFYDNTEQGITHFLLTLIKSFDIHKQPRSNLADLVEMTHIVLRLMEALREADGTLRVLKKTRKGRKKKKMAGNQHEQVSVQSGDNGSVPNPSENTRKERSSSEKVTDETAEFHEEESNSELPVDDAEEESSVFKFNGNGRVQQNSTSDNVEVCEEETECLDKDIENGAVDLNDSESNSEADEQGGKVEADFDIPKFISAFADNTVVRNYCWLLKFYKSNSAATNHYIIRMLQRICDDCMLAPMLYQLSLFSMFYEILSDEKTLQSDEYKNIVHFLTKLLRTFFKKLKDQPFLFVEILFWKTRRECNSISTDHLLSEMNKWKNKGIGDSLGCDEADGINKWRSMEGPYKRNIADALGDDEADVSLGPFDSPEKETLTNVKIKSPKKRSTIFSEEQETQIKELFEQFKEHRRCSHMIAEVLDPNGKFSAVSVSRKLKQLGLKVASSKQKSGVEKIYSDEVDKSQEDVEDDIPEKPTSADATRKTSRKRLILDSDDESEDENQQTILLKDTENKKSQIKDKKKKSPKKRKSFVFSEEQEGLIKELFEQHKENTQCSHLIAESLGLSLAQVNYKLKLLGFKATSQKRKSRFGHSNGMDDETAAGVQTEDNLNEEPLANKSLKDSEKKQSLKEDKKKKSPKKRKSHVFSEEQEALMKELFEQNKESRKCSHLIAEALGLSVAQVNRKLKLLGLKVISKKQKPGIVEDSSVKYVKNSAMVEDEDDSDHEPLITKLSKSQNVKQKNKVTEACYKSIKKFGIGHHFSDKDDKSVVGVANEGDSDDEPLSAKLLRSQNMRLQKGKVANINNESPKKTRVAEHCSDKDDETAPGNRSEDDKENETLMTSSLKSQNIRQQKRKAAEECNELGKEFRIAENCREKDDKILPMTGDEGGSDDELLITELFRSPNMRPPKRKMNKTCSGHVKECKKDDETKQKEAVEDGTVDGNLMTQSLRRRLKKHLSTHSDKTGGIKNVDLSQVGLEDLEDLETGMKFESTMDITDRASIDVDGSASLSTEDGVRDMDVLPHVQKQSSQEVQKARSGELDSMDIVNNVEEDLLGLEDNLEENISQGKDNDSLDIEEAGMDILEDTNLLRRGRRKMNMIIDNDED